MNEFVVLCRILIFDAVEKGIGLAFHRPVLADDLTARHESGISPPKRSHIQNCTQLLFRTVQCPVLRDAVFTHDTSVN